MILFALFATLFVSHCASEGDLNWWKTAVFYQIYPRSFMDLNNDGIGDIQGITSKLDYLVDLGVTAIWLSPIYKSPQVDHGYDISDYRDVDPIFGTLDDFKTLLAEAHIRSLKVILDFVPNHTSDQHQWFINSENGVPGYENYYVWKNGSSNEPPNNWISHFHGSAWKYSEKRGQWYLHQFSEGQPDLNYRDPKLVQAMKDVLTYWLDMGVDGFRVDIVSALFEDGDFPDEPLSNIIGSSPQDYNYLLHPYTEDQPETYDMVYQWRLLLDNYQFVHGGDARVMMTESYSSPNKVFGYYGNRTHNGAHFTFNFWFITELYSTSRAYDFKNVINMWLNGMPSRSTANWVLGNHDQHRVATRFGIERADGMTLIAVMLPGVTVTYNGEEIGMEDGEVTWEEAQDPQACNGLQEDFYQNSRDFQRTPFQWTTGVNAGFNNGAVPWLPIGSKYATSNVMVETADLNSHYWVYVNAVNLKKTATLKFGNLRNVAHNDHVLELTRYLNGESTYTLLVNIGNKEEHIELEEVDYTVYLASNSSKNTGEIVKGPLITLAAYEAIVLKSEG